MPGAIGGESALPVLSSIGLVVVFLIAGCAANGNGDDSPLPVVAGADANTSLLVRGRITADRLVLEPAFLLDAPASVAAESRGRHRLAGLDIEGAPMFDLRFDGTAVADAAEAEEHFTFAVPLSTGEAARLHTIELHARDGRRTSRTASLTARQIGIALEHEAAVTAERAADGNVRVAWDAQRFPMVIVRNPQTRQILTFGTGGSALVRLAGDSVEVLVSDGVRSGGRVLPVR